MCRPCRRLSSSSYWVDKPDFSRNNVACMWCQIWQRPVIYQELREHGRANTQFRLTYFNAHPPIRCAILALSKTKTFSDKHFVMIIPAKQTVIWLRYKVSYFRCLFFNRCVWTSQNQGKDYAMVQSWAHCRWRCKGVGVGGDTYRRPRRAGRGWVG